MGRWFCPLSFPSRSRESDAVWVQGWCSLYYKKEMGQEGRWDSMGGRSPALAAAGFVIQTSPENTD